MAKIIIVAILCLLLGGIHLSLANDGENSVNRTNDVGDANALLYHAKHDIDLLNYCRGHFNQEEQLIEKIEETLYRKLSEVSDISPSFDELAGTPLFVVVDVINYKNKYDIYYEGVFNNERVNNYLNLIRDSLVDNTEEYKRLPLSPLIEFYKNYEQTKTAVNNQTEAGSD